MDVEHEIKAEELTRALAYAGFVLVANELLMKMIVGPIKSFYDGMTFGEGLPFRSYEEDVRSRHPKEFEACLLYLVNFMGAIDSADMQAIQELKAHRNELAHDLVRRLPILRIDEHGELWGSVDRALFKLSNYRIRMAATTAVSRIAPPRRPAAACSRHVCNFAIALAKLHSAPRLWPSRARSP